MDGPQIIKVASRPGQADSGSDGFADTQGHGNVVVTGGDRCGEYERKNIDHSLSGCEAKGNRVRLREAEPVVRTDPQVRQALPGSVVFEEAEQPCRGTGREFIGIEKHGRRDVAARAVYSKSKRIGQDRVRTEPGIVIPQAFGEAPTGAHGERAEDKKANAGPKYLALAMQNYGCTKRCQPARKRDEAGEGAAAMDGTAVGRAIDRDRLENWR